MRNRQELAKYFGELGFKVGAEIGVCKGYYSKTLCESIPGVRLYGIDSWSNVSGFNRERHHRDLSYRITLQNLAPFIDSGQYIIIKKTSMDALSDISDKSLDFVFIDADHGYDFVRDDIREWSKKVRTGGIVSGHDYYISKMGSVGVVRAVDEYVKENNIELNIIGWHKSNPEKDGRQPCWYFLKQ